MLVSVIQQSNQNSKIRPFSKQVNSENVITCSKLTFKGRSDIKLQMAKKIIDEYATRAGFFPDGLNEFCPDSKYVFSNQIKMAKEIAEVYCLDLTGETITQFVLTKEAKIGTKIGLKLYNVFNLFPGFGNAVESIKAGTSTLGVGNSFIKHCKQMSKKIQKSIITNEGSIKKGEK